MQGLMGAAGWRALTVTGQASGVGPVPLRPLTVADLLDAPFGLLRARPGTIMALAAVAVVPAQLVAAFLARSLFTGGGFDDVFQAPFATDPQSAGAVLLANAVLAANVALLYPLAWGLVARVGISTALGEPLDAWPALRATLPRWPTLVSAWLLALLAAAALPLIGAGMVATGSLPLVALAVPVLLVALPWTVAALAVALLVPVVAVTERGGPLRVLRRAVQLVRRRVGVVLGVVVLGGLVAALVRAALSTIPRTVALLVPLQGAWVLVAVGTILAGLVVLPYLALLGVCLYLDVRVRAEALDVHVLADPGAPA